MTTDLDLRILELRDSVAWNAGVGYERRRISELLRQRVALLRELPGRTSRNVQDELLRIAQQLENTP